jgi:acyl-CoA synthetase (AMP-forming)/AMP-acid ligase II
MNSPDDAASAYAYPLLIKQLWHAPLRYAAEQEIVCGERRTSYAELYRRVGHLAGALTALGVRFGDTVAVMDWDSDRYLECFYAVPMMGAVLMTVNVRLAPEQIAYTLNHSGATVLLVHEDFVGVLQEIQPRLNGVRHVILPGGTGTAPSAIAGLAGEYEVLLDASPADFAFPEFDEHARATTFYTTGTTGDPKGVYFSHRQIVLHTLAGMAALASPATAQRFHRGDVYMPLSPMFHVHAWGMPYIALQLGVKQVYPGRYEPARLLELIEREGVTFSHCVPTLLQMVLSAPRSKQVDLSRWKVVIGGSALASGLARAARERGIDLFGGYGMSETCPILSLAQMHPHLGELDEDEALTFRCRAGVPVPLVEMRAVDGELHDVPDDGQVSGEIIVRAPWLTQGYVGRPESSEALWRSGYLHTQDVGCFERGYLGISDRIKDVIKTGGEWVSSVAVEDAISSHPSVAECAVIGVRDDTWGERPLALVVARRGESVDESEIKQLVGGHVERGLLSKYAIPDRVLAVDSLAKTSVGKLDKKLLRGRYGNWEQ